MAADPGDDLAGLDPDPHAEDDSGRRELGVQRPERSTELVPGTNGAQRIVLVEDRDPEDRHDRVTDELLDGPAVPLDDRTGRLEVAAHDPPDGLRVEPLAERGRASHVGEQDRHDLADLAPRRGAGQGGSAFGAEPGSLRVGCAAARTGSHARSLDPACLAVRAAVIFAARPAVRAQLTRDA